MSEPSLSEGLARSTRAAVALRDDAPARLLEPTGDEAPSGPRSTGRRTRAPGTTADPDAWTEARWRRLEPRGSYPRLGRRILVLGLCVASLPVIAALASVIAVVNWTIFGRAREILFRQPRVGHRGRVFWIYKFRTMRETHASDFDSWSNGHDGLRVTGFGRLLRNTHLDELPQLINILRGEMDFIGPRPEMLEIDRWACERIPGFRARNALRPGITGWAQITQGYAGKDEADYAAKLAADLHYTQNVSLRMDLEILFRTCLWMLRGRGWRKGSATPRLEDEDAFHRESSPA